VQVTVRGEPRMVVEQLDRTSQRSSTKHVIPSRSQIGAFSGRETQILGGSARRFEETMTHEPLSRARLDPVAALRHEP
jgi:hypothetical protein